MNTENWKEEVDKTIEAYKTKADKMEKHWYKEGNAHTKTLARLAEAEQRIKELEAELDTITKKYKEVLSNENSLMRDYLAAQPTQDSNPK